MSIFSGYQTATILPKRVMGFFEVNVVLSETVTDSITVTENPVDRDADKNDHFFVNSPTIEIEFVVGDRGVPLETVYQNLIEMQKSGIPFDLVTRWRLFNNMYIQTLTQSSSPQTFSVLNLKATLAQWNLVSLQEVETVPRNKQANAAKTGKTEKAGKKNAEKVDKKSVGIVSGSNVAKKPSILNESAGGTYKDYVNRPK